MARDRQRLLEVLWVNSAVERAAIGKDHAGGHDSSFDASRGANVHHFAGDHRTGHRSEDGDVPCDDVANDGGVGGDNDSQAVAPDGPLNRALDRDILGCLNLSADLDCRSDDDHATSIVAHHGMAVMSHQSTTWSHVSVDARPYHIPQIGISVLRHCSPYCKGQSSDL